MSSIVHSSGPISLLFPGARPRLTDETARTRLVQLQRARADAQRDLAAAEAGLDALRVEARRAGLDAIVDELEAGAA